MFRWIARDDQQRGAPARLHRAPLVLAFHQLCCVIGGRANRLQRRPARVNQQFQFVMETFALKYTRIRCIRAGGNQESRIMQFLYVAHGFLMSLKIFFRLFLFCLGLGLPRVLRQFGQEPWRHGIGDIRLFEEVNVVQPRVRKRFRDHQRGYEKNAMLLGKLDIVVAHFSRGQVRETRNSSRHEIRRTIALPLINDHANARFASLLRKPVQHVLGKVGIAFDHIHARGLVAAHEFGNLVAAADGVRQVGPRRIGRIHHGADAIDARPTKASCRLLLPKLQNPGLVITGVEQRGHARVKHGIEVSLVAQQVDRCAVPCALQVHMQVRQTRHDCLSGAVDDLRVFGNARTSGGSGILNRFAADQHGRVLHRSATHSVDQTGVNDCDGFTVGRARRRTQGNQQKHHFESPSSLQSTLRNVRDFAIYSAPPYLISHWPTQLSLGQIYCSRPLHISNSW